MRGAVQRVLLTGAAFVSLSGCSGSLSQNAAVPVTAQRIVKQSHVRLPQDLYVLSRTNSVVYMLHNKTYQDLGVITNGVNGASDVDVDRQGNLYVANSSGPNIVEYPPGASSSSFTYSAGMESPNSVTVDAHGNVFEGDADGVINEYFQGYDAVAASSSIGQLNGYEIGGLAVDSVGDVFINLYAPGYSDILVELYGGLGGYQSGILTYTGRSRANIAIDAKNNLLIPVGGAVDVIDPPYTGVSGTIGSGFSGATDVKLNRANTLAFVTDTTNQTVTVVSYPAGSNVTVLGKTNGLINPYAAVDGPNAVY